MGKEKERCFECKKEKELFCCKECYNKIVCEIVSKIMEGQSYDRVNRDLRNLSWNIETLTKAINTLIPKEENKVEIDKDGF